VTRPDDHPRKSMNIVSIDKVLQRVRDAVRRAADMG
jgi:hypothetical protein